MGKLIIVTITASGPIGSGKSALLGEFELTLRSLGIPYHYQDPVAAVAEKHLTGADWIGELERTKPTVLLVDQKVQDGVVAVARRLALEEAARMCDEMATAAKTLQVQFESGERLAGPSDVALSIASIHTSTNLAAKIREKAKI